MACTKIAVIGCGFFAPNHLHAWNELSGAKLIAVCDIDENKVAAAAAHYSVPGAFTDAAEMLAVAKPDLVDIVTTMDSHRMLVELCAANGIPVIVQKPFGPTPSDCAAMVQACRDADVMLMVHENFRHQHPMRQVKAVLDAGTIGQAVWGRVSFRTGYDVKAGQPYLFNEERFIVLDLGIHLLDLARFFFGEVKSLYSRHARIDSRVKGEDMATMMLGHASGATSIVDCTYESRQLPDLFPQTLVTIEGTKGAMDLKSDFRLSISTGGTCRTEDVSSPLRAWTSQPWHVTQDSVYHTQTRALAAFAGGYEPETSGSDNLKSYALIEAAYRSAKSGECVRL
ncbi:MAG: Gfo/Idh/MocA family oxidoreductase [Hyphomicrobiales bacterium]|nr:Gfo/Idh/MocA family oxidoreductase [Hyphomicrobiales bacterium]MCP5002219.1 Gfo/Idh/MocA family oxidoreductase [Hyphomicrobiales bacterium]